MYDTQGFRAKAFSEIAGEDYFKQFNESIKNDIERQGKNYILGVDKAEFEKHLVEKYTLEPLVVDFENEEIVEPSRTIESKVDRYGETYQVDVYDFIVRYPFTGTSSLFKVQPSAFNIYTYEIYINFKQQTVSFSFKLYQQDATAFTQTKNKLQSIFFGNLQNINKDVGSWNKQLPEFVHSLFSSIKRKYEKENSFFEAINVKVNKDTASVFVPPTIKKTIIPQPSVSDKKVFSSEPMMAKEMYDDILRVIYDSGKSMEKKPALYKEKDEEGLRDQFLFVLETRYEGTTATGETFNRSGKTDIILKYSKDGSNLFVAECKFWHGSAEFLKAISQLFDKYLTWRDSKAALLIFVKNKEFSKVLQNVREEIKAHPYFMKDNGSRGETSFSYIFHLPQDTDKKVFLEVLAFHYDK